MDRIFISDAESGPTVCFNTGLDPRSFARTKMSQSLVESGYVVNPNGSSNVWRPAGVYESNGIMQVWGHLFNGKRLDQLLENVSSLSQNNSSQIALQAVVLWTRAKMSLGETRSAFNPGASFICFENGKSAANTAKAAAYPKGTVFFAPEYLSNRCLFIEGSQLDRYNCPDLLGIEAAAFCMGVMLYTILAGTHPYPTTDIYQDMREGVFVPVDIASPVLNEKLSELINSALMLPVENKKIQINAVDIISDILKILINDEGRINPISSHYKTLTTEETKQAEKEKKQFIFKQNSMVKTRRFVMRNKIPIIAAFFIAVFAGVIIFTTVAGRSQRPSLAGLSSEAVLRTYYDKFSELDHLFMEEILWGADKADLNTAIGYTAVLKTIQAYEMTPVLRVRKAKAWKDNGGELPAPDVFGVTDLTIELLAGTDYENLVVYRTNYYLWPLNENYSLNRSDIVTLRLDRKKNWRITEILRTER